MVIRLSAKKLPIFDFGAECYVHTLAEEVESESTHAGRPQEEDRPPNRQRAKAVA